MQIAEDTIDRLQKTRQANRELEYSLGPMACQAQIVEWQEGRKGKENWLRLVVGLSIPERFEDCSLQRDFHKSTNEADGNCYLESKKC